MQGDFFLSKKRNKQNPLLTCGTTSAWKSQEWLLSPVTQGNIHILVCAFGVGCSPTVEKPPVLLETSSPQQTARNTTSETPVAPWQFPGELPFGSSQGCPGKVNRVVHEQMWGTPGPCSVPVVTVRLPSHPHLQAGETSGRFGDNGIQSLA